MSFASVGPDEKTIESRWHQWQRKPMFFCKWLCGVRQRMPTHACTLPEHASTASTCLHRKCLRQHLCQHRLHCPPSCPTLGGRCTESSTGTLHIRRYLRAGGRGGARGRHLRLPCQTSSRFTGALSIFSFSNHSH